jgi:predicted lipoprotein with Yx(FWY)xxD motif
MNTRRALIVVSLAAVALLASTAARAWASGSTKPTVQIRQTAKGKILVDGRGFTLYVYSRDTRNHDACVHVSGCSSVWPVMKATGPLKAGSGVKSRLLGTIKLGRTRQVTYAGHPLYHYIADSSPGQTDYVGQNVSGGFWYVLNAAGKVIK